MASLRTGVQQRARGTAERLVTPLARLGLTPNGVTILGLLMNGVAAAVLALSTAPFIAGGVLVLVAGAFDMFDGALARVTNRKSTFGAFFDSTVDRVSEAVVFLGVMVSYLRHTPLDAYAMGVVVLCYVVMTSSIMISYARARAEGLQPRVDCEVGWLQRPERIIILGIGLLFPDPVPLAVLAVLAVLTTVTVFQRVLHVRRVTTDG